MKKSTYLHGIAASHFYNFNELVAHTLTRRRPPADIEVEKELKYGEGVRERYRLLYTKDRSKRQPLMIYIHGGGFISGNLDLRDNYCIEFVKRGFFVASIDYDYAPKHVFPTQIRQCFKAIERILDGADKYNFDPEKVLIAGESAGSYFVYYVSAAAREHSLYDRLGIDFAYRDTFDVTAAVSICGVTDMQRALYTRFPDIKIMLRSFTDKTLDELRNGAEREDIRLLSPPVNEKVPPSVLIYATADRLGPESVYLKEKLDEYGVPNVLLKADGLIAAHAFAVAPIFKKSRKLIDKTYEFIAPYFF